MTNNASIQNQNPNFAQRLVNGENHIPTFRTEAWATDFSLPYLWKVTDAVIDNGYSLTSVTDALDASRQPDSRIGIIRHDIDEDLIAAHTLAQKEKDRGTRATYFVIPNAEEYKITSVDSIRLLSGIVEAGHELGLHYNPDERIRKSNMTVDDLEEDVSHQAKMIEQVVGNTVRSVSFHYASEDHQDWIDDGRSHIAGLVNAYSSQFWKPSEFALYATDSWGKWVYGEPIQRIQKASMAGARVIQVLTHVEHWHMQ